MSDKAELYRTASPWYSQRRIRARRLSVKCGALLGSHRGMTDYPVAPCNIQEKKKRNNSRAGVAAELPSGTGLSRVLVFPSWSVLWIPLQ